MRNYKSIISAGKKLVKVGIIGMPNSGKSTLINDLSQRRSCPTSSKVHTTRAQSMAIFTEGDTQVVFIDTPGLVNQKEQKKFNLEKTFIRDPKNALKEADVIGVVHDTSNVYGREKLDIKIVNLLEHHRDSPSFLVLNKIDLLKSKRKLLDIARILTESSIDGSPVPRQGVNEECKHQEYKGWPHFKEVFMISALYGDGVEDLRSHIVRQAKPAEWMFPEEIWTDQRAEDIITSSVQAKLLDFLPQEIPYKLRPELEYFDINSSTGVMTTCVTVKSPSKRISSLVAGTADGRLKQIVQSVQDDLQNTFHNFVRVKIVLDPSPSDSL
ncbi:GTPase Era, mitochondrial [Anthonomus grandis grandis]|uniref:GTPase Era, mitochondrial n=1 Tax=Anthonomus grandis grandis TaxID=2921223 RepID=UPI002166C0E6|nr:GTPase Era, mitochondrial [Anthonomus grandis grandis]